MVIIVALFSMFTSYSSFRSLRCNSSIQTQLEETETVWFPEHLPEIYVNSREQRIWGYRKKEKNGSEKRKRKQKSHQHSKQPHPQKHSGVEFSLPHPGLCRGELKKKEKSNELQRKPLPLLCVCVWVCLSVCVYVSACLPVYPQCTWLTFKAVFNRNHTVSWVRAKTRDWSQSWIKVDRNMWRRGVRGKYWKTQVCR